MTIIRLISNIFRPPTFHTVFNRFPSPIAGFKGNPDMLMFLQCPLASLSVASGYFLKYLSILR